MHQEGHKLPKVVSLITQPFLTPFRCLNCDISFSNLEAIQIHLNVNFWSNTGESFISSDQESYIGDMDIHRPSCPQCNKKFSSEKGVNLHMGKKHPTDQKKEQCIRCGSKFSHKYALDFHMRQVHEKSTRVECQKCKKWFYNKYVLQGHLIKCNLFHSLL